MKRNLVFAVALAATMTMSVACEKAKMGEEALEGSVPAAQDAAGVAEGMSAATISITPQGGVPINFTVMIAETKAQKAQGLKNVESLPVGHGMWFEFPEQGIYEFWMKDTMVPLDWIFVDENMKVVDVKRNNQPCAPDANCPSYSPSSPHKFVLEVNAGETAAINPGDDVDKSVGPAS